MSDRSQSGLTRETIQVLIDKLAGRNYNRVIMEKQNASPYSTGGGGTTFEQLVGATYLVTLLAKGSPRGLEAGTIKEVGFERGGQGDLLDDIVVTG